MRMVFRYCSIASGSSGNCHYIETAEARILVDAGLSGKIIQAGLDQIGIDPKSLDLILITHEHTDHCKGAGILSRRFDLPIYANEATWEAMKGGLGKIKPEHICQFKTGESFRFRDVQILPFATHHDSVEAVGFRFEKEDKRISMVTDTGHICDSIKAAVEGSNLYLIEANHDVNMLRMGSYPWPLKKRIESDWGHLSNEAAGEFISELCKGQKSTVLLGHLSQENNFPELAYQTVKNILTENGIYIDEGIELDMALRHAPTKIYEV